MVVIALRVCTLRVLGILAAVLAIYAVTAVFEQSPLSKFQQIICGYERQAHNAWARNAKPGSSEPSLVDCE